ncbi:hypothetical protein QQF64_035530 [Cirrhinus molitorella]|uniref:Uncharacterized protein n=1 Tax=Cirrhinus molitorella TaxID=172907 RepID=A0ABR3NGP5_9TELE
MQCSFSQQNSPPLHWRSLQSLDLSKIHPTGQNNCSGLLFAFSVPCSSDFCWEEAIREIKLFELSQAFNQLDNLIKLRLGLF